MPGHEKKGKPGEADPDPAPYLIISLDLKKEEIAKTLVKASKGTPLYFLQQFNLAGQNVLCFFDSGAMFNLIKTAIARILDLKMVSRT